MYVRMYVEANVYRESTDEFWKRYRDCSQAVPTGDTHISSGHNEYIIHNLFGTVDL